MSIDFSAIISGPIIRPRKIVLYGTGGIGKSTWASTAPAPIFLPTEEGLDTIKVPRFPILTSYQEVLDVLAQLYNQAHKYKTVVLDSLDWTERLIWVEVARKQGKESIEDIGYAKGYVFALDFWHKLLEGFTALRDEKGMAVILIAHAGLEKMENPEGDNYDRHAPRLHKKAAAVVCEWADEVLFASYRQFTRKAETEKKAKAIGNGERIVRTVERPAFVAKNRLDLPEELPLSWAEYEKFLPGNKNEKSKKEKA